MDGTEYAANAWHICLYIDISDQTVCRLNEISHSQLNLSIGSIFLKNVSATLTVSLYYILSITNSISQFPSFVEFSLSIILHRIQSHTQRHGHATFHIRYYHTYISMLFVVIFKRKTRTPHNIRKILFVLCSLILYACTNWSIFYSSLSLSLVFRCMIQKNAKQHTYRYTHTHKRYIITNTK